MKDSTAQMHVSDEAGLDVFLEDFCVGAADALGDCLHEDAVLFGLEDGLFVSGDRHVWLSFARRMSREPKAGRMVVWRQVSGRVAMARVVESTVTGQRVLHLSLMRLGAGWKIMSQVFEAESGAGF